MSHPIISCKLNSAVHEIINLTEKITTFTSSKLADLSKWEISGFTLLAAQTTVLVQMWLIRSQMVKVHYRRHRKRKRGLGSRAKVGGKDSWNWLTRRLSCSNYRRKATWDWYQNGWAISVTNKGFHRQRNQGLFFINLAAEGGLA